MTAQTATANARYDRPAARLRRRGLDIALWTVQGLLALFFVWGGAPKVLGVAGTVEAFDQIGYGQWFRVLTGLVELAGAIGIVVPRLSGLAAAGLAAVMVCASAVNLAYLDMGPSSLVTTGALFALFTWIAWIRRDQTRRLIAAFRR